MAALFLFAGILTGCDDPTKIGLDLTPGQDIPGLQVLTYDSVQVNTLLLDSVKTSNTGVIFVGHTTDPEPFGTSTATAYVQFEPGSSGAALKDNAIADSVVLTMPYQYVYGDTSASFSMKVYPLTDAFNDSAYYSSQTLNYDASQPWADITFRPSLDDGVLRFKVLNLGQRLLDNGGNTLLQNETNFLNLFKGLALVPNANNKSIIGFELRDSPSLVFYYHTAAEPASANYSFTFNSSTKHFSNLQHQRTGLLANMQRIGDTLPSTLAGGQAFLQSGFGFRATIKFPGLEKLRERIGTASIVKAEMLVSRLDDNADFFPPTYLSLVETSKANRNQRSSSGVERVLVNDLALMQGQVSYLFEYSVSNKRYSLPITTYVSAIANQTVANGGLILTPASASYSVNRLIIGDGSSQTPAAKRLQLRVYYLPATASGR